MDAKVPPGAAEQTRVGRRAGPSTTRDEIARAAREQFADKGYDKASLRAIAERAGVDPALITYFFRTKQQLFVQVVELPFDPADVVRRLLDGPMDGVGRRLAGFVLQVLSTEENRQRLVGLIRSATADNDAAVLVRERVTAQVLEPLAAALGAPDARLRAALVMSQIAGFTMARHVIGLDPLRDAAPDELAAALGGTLQRYLSEDLTC